MVGLLHSPRLETLCCDCRTSIAKSRFVLISEIELTRTHRQPGTLTWRDLESGQMRNEAKIHVIRLNETTKEIQDLDIAQQYEPAKRKGRLFKIANQAVKAYFGPRPGQKEYVSCLFLDTKWVRSHQMEAGPWL